MSDQFSWRTDEDEGWDDTPLHSSSKTKKRRPWLWLLAVTAAALTIILVLYLRLQEQVETATATAETELLAAHQLIQQAAASNDLDLFRSNLSRRDPAWADAQRALISTGLYLDRSAFGLRWWGETPLNLSDAAATPTLPITITLSPDLLAAEVIYEEEYLIEGSSDVSQTIRLQQTAIYRRGSGRWLRADPQPEFWGVLRTTERGYLTVTYSRRDEAIVQQLANDFDTELKRMCLTLTNLDCTDLHLELRLTRDPASFFSLVQLEDVIAPEEGEIILPAPTLVGLPVDEAGYQQIMKGYTAQLVAAAITQLLAYECCHHGLFYHAFMDRLLSDLDLRAVPPLPNNLNENVQEIMSYGMPSLWGHNSLDYSDTTTLPYLYSLADFLLTSAKPSINTVDLLNGLRPNINFDTWLSQVTAESGTSLALVTMRWASYIAEQTNPMGNLPLPLPSGSIQLSCNAADNLSRVFRFDIETQYWTETQQVSEFFIPVHNGYAAADGGANQQTLLYLDTANRQTSVITTTTTIYQSFQPNYFYGSLLYGPPPTGYFYFAVLENNSYPPLTSHWLADLTSCEAGRCDLQRLPGIPIWSPDSQHMILYEDVGEDLRDHLFMADGTGHNLTAVGQGYLPFWLDNDHYGYFIRDENDTFSHILTGQVDQAVPEIILIDTELHNRLNPGDLAYFYLAWAMPRPQFIPHRLAILAYGRSNTNNVEHYYLLEMQWDENWQTVTDVQLSRQSENGLFPFYSPDGRYLVLLEDTVQSSHLTLINQETLAEQSYAVADFFNFPNWSRDGQWLIQMTSTEVVLIAPDYQIEKRIPFTQTFCSYYYYVPGE